MCVIVEDLSLHILDIAENSVQAGARNLVITVDESLVDDRLVIEIRDDGKGMTAEIADKVSDPFYTTRTTRRVGMGLTLLKHAAELANGTMVVRSQPDHGTTVRATFQHSHIDRMPLGSMADTVTALISREEMVNVLYRHVRGGRVVEFDSKHVQDQLGDILLDSTEALSLVRRYIELEEVSLAQ